MKRSRKALWRALLGLALLAAVLALADVGRVLARLREAQWGWLAAGLLAAVASNVVSALRWRALARWLGCELGAGQANRWYFQAMSLNALLPGAVVGGDVYRAVQLRRAGQLGAAAGWSVLGEDRLSGLWMLCAVARWWVRRPVPTCWRLAAAWRWACWRRWPGPAPRSGWRCRGRCPGCCAARTHARRSGAVAGWPRWPRRRTARASARQLLAEPGLLAVQVLLLGGPRWPAAGWRWACAWAWRPGPSPSRRCS